MKISIPLEVNYCAILFSIYGPISYEIGEDYEESMIVNLMEGNYFLIS